MCAARPTDRNDDTASAATRTIFLSIGFSPFEVRFGLFGSPDEQSWRHAHGRAIAMQTRRINRAVEREPVLRGRAAVSVSNRAGAAACGRTLGATPYVSYSGRSARRRQTPKKRACFIRQHASGELALGHRFRNRHRILIYRAARDE
jgi:hypothetical protein